MEPDRYQFNHTLFIIAMICVLICFVLLSFSLYLIPNLFWGWEYNIPDFVSFWREDLIDRWEVSDRQASSILVAFFFVGALIAGFISKLATNAIDKKLVGMEEAQASYHQERHESLHKAFWFGIKLLILIAVVLLVIFFINWLISEPTTLAVTNEYDVFPPSSE